DDQATYQKKRDEAANRKLEEDRKAAKKDGPGKDGRGKDGGEKDGGKEEVSELLKRDDGAEKKGAADRDRQMQKARSAEEQVIEPLAAGETERAKGLALAVLGDGFASHVTFSPDGRLLAAVNSRAVKLWDLRTGKVRHEFT